MGAICVSVVFPKIEIFKMWSSVMNRLVPRLACGRKTQIRPSVVLNFSAARYSQIMGVPQSPTLALLSSLRWELAVEICQLKSLEQNLWFFKSPFLWSVCEITFLWDDKSFMFYVMKPLWYSVSLVFKEVKWSQVEGICVL